MMVQFMSDKTGPASSQHVRVSSLSWYIVMGPRFRVSSARRPGIEPTTLVYKANSITSAPRRLKRLTPLSPTSELEFYPLLLSGNGFFQEAQAGGSYPAAIKLKAEPNPDCDPTQQECEMWLPGNYTVKIGNISVIFHVHHLRSLGAFE